MRLINRECRTTIQEWAVSKFQFAQRALKGALPALRLRKPGLVNSFVGTSDLHRVFTGLSACAGAEPMNLAMRHPQIN